MTEYNGPSIAMDDSKMLWHFSKQFLWWKKANFAFLQSSINQKWQYLAFKVYSNGTQIRQLVLKSLTSHKKPIIWDAKYHICNGMIENLHPLGAFYFVAALKFPPCNMPALEWKRVSVLFGFFRDFGVHFGAASRYNFGGHEKSNQLRARLRVHLNYCSLDLGLISC